MEIKEYSPNEIIYHQGDTTEYIYLVLLGKIELKGFEYQSKMNSFDEYCQYLCSINDSFLLQTTINHNEHIYPIKHEADIKIIPLLRTKIEIIKYAAVSDIQSIALFYQSKQIDTSFMNFNEVLSNELSMDAYYDNLLLSFTEKEKHYSKFINPAQNEITVINYIQLMPEENIKCFGNFTLGESNYQLSESVLAMSPTILLLVNKKLYSNSVINDHKILIEKEINYLHESYFFKGMRRGLFAKHYFFEFSLEIYPLNHILFKQNDQIDKLYIIKEGSVELSINNKSPFELKHIIFKLKSLDRSQFTKEEYDDTVKLLNPLSSLMQFLKHKQNFVLFKTSNTCLGEWECYYNTTAMYTARITSDQTRIYSMPLEKLLNKDNEDISALNYFLKDAAFQKLKGIIKRIISVKKTQFEKVDSEYSKSIQEDDQIDQMINVSKDINTSPLKYANSIINTLPTNQSLFSNRKIKKITHKKVASLFNTPHFIRPHKDKNTEMKVKDLLNVKYTSLFEEIVNSKVPLNTKQGIILIEQKRKIQRNEQNKNTSATIEYTLPNIYNKSHKSRNMKNSTPSLSSLPKTLNDCHGLKNLELSVGSLPSNKKTLNYLAVKKYREYSYKAMMEVIKLKYKTKINKRFIVNKN